MSLEVTSQTEAPKVYALYSATAELIALTNVLADPKHHASMHGEVQLLLSCLSEGSKAFLNQVAELPYQGIEFFELLLECRIFNDIDAFVTTIRQYDNQQFILILAGGELNEKQLQLLIEDKQALPQWLNDLPWVYRGKSAVFESMLYQTQSFKDHLASLLSEIHQLFFRETEPKLKKQYDKALETLNLGLTQGSYEAVAEKIMNRKIAPDNSIKEILFVPSYYISPHYVMAYNKLSRMFLYDMRKEKEGSGNSKQKLSAELKILGDETRLEIVRLLILQPTYGKLLADRLHLTTATISHHLDVLSSAHLISESREGNTKYFSANEEEINRLITELNNFLYNS